MASPLKCDLCSNPATVHLTQSNDPWVRRLVAAARVRKEPIVQPAAPTASATNEVEIVSRGQDLVAESMAVTVDLTPID